VLEMDLQILDQDVYTVEHRKYLDQKV